MKNMIRSTVLFLFCIAAVSITYGDIPPMNVTVSDASGKAAYKGATSPKGAFATAKLQPGEYVVQLNSKSGAVKGNHYAIVVAAGKKKVSASAVPGEKFTGGGVALKVDVGSGLNISGQVAAEDKSSVQGGKKMVWMPPMLGSNMPGRWVEEGSPEHQASKNRGSIGRENIQKIQENSYNPQGN